MKKLTMSLCSVGGAVAATVMLTATSVLPAGASGVHPDSSYRSGSVSCTANQHGKIGFTYKGHVSAFMTNGTGDTANRDFFYNGGDGSYTTQNWEAGQSIKGGYIFGSVTTTGGSADISAFGIVCQQDY